jgi:dephospho-CoA kinase
MSRLIMVSGQPASGKTTGAESLDPKETVFLDADGKGMSWIG